MAVRTSYRVVERSNFKATEIDVAMARKRKPESSGDASLDLNLPVYDNNMIVPLGTVNNRINQLGQASAHVESDPEMQKKQKLSTNK